MAAAGGGGLTVEAIKEDATPPPAPPSFDVERFRANGHAMVDYIADLHTRLQSRTALPVRPNVEPGFLQLGPLPAGGSSLAEALADFERLVLPGVTHWQHPRFFAYFPAQASFTAMLGDLLMSSLNNPNFSWVCNPADAEMEVQVGDWLAEALGLGARFTWAGGLGAATIQPSATEAMVVVARAALDRARRRGLLGSDSSAAVAYVSEQAHFCTAKGCAIVGIGHVRKIPAPFDGRNFPMDTRALAACMAADVEAGLCPVLIGVSHGTTGTCAFDDAVAAAALAAEHKCWLGVDAAYAGTAAVCPEKRTVFAGWELADSLVINGSKSFHLLLGSTFLFVANRKDISPSLNHTGEYLKTGSKAAAQSGDGAAVSAQAPTGASAVERDGDFSRPAGSVAGRASDVQPVDLKDFNLGLGRPWRSLKIWLQLRIEGLEPVRATIRRHHAYAAHVAEQLLATPSTAVGADDRPTPNQQQADASRPHVFRQGPLFELPTEPALGLVTFRLRGFDDAANARFLARLNAPRPAADGAAQHDLFLVEARAGGRMLLRIAMASPVLSQGDIDWLLALIRREARAFVQEELRGSA